QSPLFIAALAGLFTLIGLNLAGVFEFGALLPARWSAARARHPLTDSLLTGVLAVAVASPCTAPFMGAALGAAVTLPPAQALMVFVALGLGMAAPYLLASAWPMLARALPHPGGWMVTFRTLMAFPMFATVIWLVWVLGQQSGIDAVAGLLGTLLALAFLAWALGTPALGARTRNGLGALAFALTALALGWAWPALHGTPASATTHNEAGWEPWSPERVAELGTAGRAVFVDFTAAWCVTCQYNKRTTLADEAVLAAFATRNVALLRADWTRRDARITAELTRLGRSGVPVYALYAPGAPEPQLLGEILRRTELHEALARLPAPR
ncbi:MAG: thioredoxin family protein, partial [Rubrivivax sp.]|nr:thioredoxin family protein [Rubrivivax sp.]